MNVRRNKKTATKEMEQQRKMTSKKGNANYTKQTVMLLGLPGIGKSTVMNRLSSAAAAPFEARLAPWIMEAYMAEYFCLKQATVDGLFSDDFLDDASWLR